MLRVARTEEHRRVVDPNISPWAAVGKLYNQAS
jgi:hypothetical protein